MEQAALWSQDFPITRVNQAEAEHYRGDFIQLVGRALWIYDISCFPVSFPNLRLCYSMVAFNTEMTWVGFGGFIVSLTLYHITNCLHCLFKWIQFLKYLIRQCIQYLLDFGEGGEGYGNEYNMALVIKELWVFQDAQLYKGEYRVEQK